MPTTPTSVSMTLDRTQFLRLPEPAGLCLRVGRGTLWITIDGRRADLELGPGEQMCFEPGTAPALVGTLGGDAEFRAIAPREAAGRPQLSWA